MFALVITGPPGAGKSSVLEALSDQLVVDDMRHAVIETEALTSSHPALDGDQWYAPIAAVSDLYKRFGYRLLLVIATLEGSEDLRRLLAALDSDEHAVVRLDAEPGTLRRRIAAREPEGWSGLDELLAASDRLRTVIADLDGIAMSCSTEGRRPQHVAEQIRDRFREVLEPRDER